MNCLKSCEPGSDKTNRTSFVQRRQKKQIQRHIEIRGESSLGNVNEQIFSQPFLKVTKLADALGRQCHIKLQLLSLQFYLHYSSFISNPFLYNQKPYIVINKVFLTCCVLLKTVYLYKHVWVLTLVGSLVIRISQQHSSMFT